MGKDVLVQTAHPANWVYIQDVLLQHLYLLLKSEHLIYVLNLPFLLMFTNFFQKLGIGNANPASGKSKPRERSAWHALETLSDLEDALQASFKQPVVLFKHSTRCGVSSHVSRNLNKNWNISDEAVRPYFLDLIAHRDISQAIADKLEVWHQSPQIIVVQNGAAIYDASHNQISVGGIREVLSLED